MKTLLLSATILLFIILLFEVCDISIKQLKKKKRLHNNHEFIVQNDSLLREITEQSEHLYEIALNTGLISFSEFLEVQGKPVTKTFISLIENRMKK